MTKKEKPKIETLPATDDVEFRKKQMEHVVNGIKDMGDT
jgi:hypothetical protein